MNHRSPWKLATTLLAASAVLVACSESGPTAPPGLKPNFTVGDPFTPGANPVLGKLVVCKAGNTDGAFNVTGAAVNGGSFTAAGATTVTVGTCKVVAEDGDAVTGVGANITVNENPNTNLQSITAKRNDNGSVSSFSFTNNTSLFLNSFHGYVITFTNTVVSQGCTFTWGYWKTHDGSGPQPNAWPVSSLTLGTVTYTKAQLQSILGTPPAGNGLISLAHQLIAAKLNILNGANGSSIAATIAAANTLIDGKVIPPVGSGSLKPNQVSALVQALDDFNSGVTGPGHCDDEEAVD